MVLYLNVPSYVLNCIPSYVLTYKVHTLNFHSGQNIVEMLVLAFDHLVKDKYYPLKLNTKYLFLCFPDTVLLALSNPPIWNSIFTILLSALFSISGCEGATHTRHTLYNIHNTIYIFVTASIDQTY